MKRYILLSVLILALSLSFANDLRLDVMWSNDIHGGIDRSKATFMNPEFPPQLGGGASAATLIEHIRSWSSENRANLLLDAGDFFQGRPVGTVTQGRAVIEFLNATGYDALTLGNHEFDILQEELEETLEMANFPILSCNVIDTRTGKIPWYAFPYTIVNRLGLRIGILGVTTTDTKQMSFPENIRNIDFLDEKETVTKYVKILREEEKVDIVIVLGHAGLPYDNEKVYLSRYDAQGNPRHKERRSHWGYDAQEIAREVEGIDLFIGGHIHKGVPQPWVDPVTHTMVIHGYAYGSGMGLITLTIDPETKTVSGYETPALREGALITLFEDQFIPDPEVSEMIEAHVAIAEKGMDEIVGVAGVHLSRTNVDAQSPMGNTIVDAMRYRVDADFAFLNLGGVRAEIKSGPVTYRDVFEVMPFDNMLITFTCDGETLKRIIETRVEGSRAGLIVSGVNVVYSRTRPSWDRVTSLKIGGEPWDPDKIYTVATTDFLMQGNAGLTLLMNIPSEDITNHNINLRDAIVHYFKQESPITTKIDDRWKRSDDSAMAPWMKP
ncbi:MAG: 5'-nucleotidase C-terminal domain-containing protein [Candidatus Cloacimonadaceae bacterium]|jgi:2',3'-cyclic-nucleotide 2'-phosphodiesterase (5'-nucleotidase family)|nr:5'-nucleotidase C-terminal domain-containing protein [Candidatus Cloacimonadota bacterium]MDY0127575.1 5'-nucleotidase C-terminal domain-containing protein [Candidatus Cloacimonadaceae bacterium]MCB5255439.1 5'-nucleotidase C-terminal domain-containing protein [Candidatus Cloacimonadota bacterium]MCK9177894.1 5'-nucleotidase C-terminal domain-containing protein [Candidatus Cloacimonadota bacterium]MCK9242033.1 5'-nucleotidase C-terminal domain-containing protein [Candidatus Cloacimonadota ba